MVRDEIHVEMGQPFTYCIKVQGELDLAWSDWLSVESLSVSKGITIMTGTFIDQVALHSLLEKIRNLGLPLLSIYPVHSENE